MPLVAPGKPPKFGPSLAALALLCAAPFVLFWPALFSGQMIFGHDVAALGLPFHAEMLRNLAAHEWPLWMPDLLGGMPGIAACNLQSVYPTDLIGNLAQCSLRGLDAFDAVFHVALAGVGMFLFLRRLERSVSAALLGALFFALSGSLVSQLNGGFYNFLEGIALVPWAFWAAHKACREGSLALWGLCGSVFALQILAQATQTFVYTLAALACFSLAQTRRERRNALSWGSTLAGLALALAFAFLVSAPQSWLTAQYLPLSARQGYSRAFFESGSIRWTDALTWLVPGFYGWAEPNYHGAVTDSFTSEYFGLLPWALAFGSLAAYGRRQAWVPWMAGLALAAVFFAQREWIPFYPLFHNMPVLSGFRVWSRILFLVPFAVCTQAAFGWDALRDPATRRSALSGALFLGALALACGGVAWAFAPSQAQADAPNMPWLAASLGSVTASAALLTRLARDSSASTLVLALVLTAALGAGLARRASLGVPALVLALAFHGLDQGMALSHTLHFINPQTALSLPAFTGPPPPQAGVEPWRVFDPDSANPSNAMVLGYENLYGEDSIPLDRFLKLMGALQKSPKSREEFFNLFNVRYLFAHSKQKSSAPGDQVRVYANPHALPRAWLVQRSRIVRSEDEEAHLWTDPSFDPSQEVALAADPGLPPAQGPSGPRCGSVRWLARSPQSEELETDCDAKAVLVVSNCWYPSWRCWVDGQEKPLLRADGTLQALVVEPGRRHVRLLFDPGLFEAALAAAAAGLGLLALMFCFPIRSGQGGREMPARPMET